MLEHLIQITPLCFMIAVIATVYMRVLAYEPIFKAWFNWGATHGIKVSTAGPQPMAVYLWWYKPLFECEKCLAGQMGLWSYLIYLGHLKRGPMIIYYPVWPNYDLICHLYTITGSIAFTLIVSTLYTKLKKHF